VLLLRIAIARKQRQQGKGGGDGKLHDFLDTSKYRRLTVLMV